MNRALGRRPYFENRIDKRFFLALLAKEASKGRIRVHAYTLMTNHFHILVESQTGELSQAMWAIENPYSRVFNRLRDRDGPLVRARFFSKRVRTDGYRHAVVRYIDRNAVSAGLAQHPEEYEFCSARAHTLGAGQPWLERGWIRDRIAQCTGSDCDLAGGYRATFGDGSGPRAIDIKSVVEARMSSAREEDPLEEMLTARPDWVQGWLQSRATIADGERVGLPVCAFAALRSALDDEDRRTAAIGFPEASAAASVGLTRELCGTSWAATARLVGTTIHRARRLRTVHDIALRDNPSYSRLVSEIASRAVRVTFHGKAAVAGEGSQMAESH